MSENIIPNGTIVKIIKRVKQWGSRGVTWPTVDYELIGLLAIIKDNSKASLYGYKTLLACDEDEDFIWFPEESLSVCENQNILLLKIQETHKQIKIYSLNDGDFLKDESDNDLRFQSKEEAVNYINHNYDQYID